MFIVTNSWFRFCRQFFLYNGSLSILVSYSRMSDAMQINFELIL